jgi:AraC-like DNA-binding protein
MEKPLSIEEFYREKCCWMPENLRRDIGHFNIFRFDDFGGSNPKPVPFNRKYFYKISLIGGHSRFLYADKVVEFEKNAIVFSNPQIPYTFEYFEEARRGYFCIFTEAFFSQFGNLRDYPMYQPGNSPVFKLNDEQMAEFMAMFEEMSRELASGFEYKYDSLRTMVFQLIHKALKIQPLQGKPHDKSNAAVRVASVFTELLERQFPIENPGQQIRLKAPSEYADQLSVHVNHLNRSLKTVTGKTTSKLIQERLLREACVLLRHTDWNISEIAWSLGFEELPHFTNFFRLNMKQTPKRYRELENV